MSSRLVPFTGLLDGREFLETQRVEVFSAYEGKLLIQFFVFHIP